MLLLQVQKSQEPDFSAWNTPKNIKKGEKLVSDFVHWAIMNMPDRPLSEMTGGYGKGLKCMVHYLNASGVPLKLDFTEQEWKYILNDTKLDISNLVNKCWYSAKGYSGGSEDREKFKARMKKEGFDFDKMAKEMKEGERREIVDSRGRPYVAYVKRNDWGGRELNFVVDYNRTWLPADKDGWERMKMVRGGVNTTDASTSAMADAWNVLGYTTLARRSRKDGGYDYKIEETFDLLGSASSGGMAYTRVVPSPVGYVIKKLFPNISVDQEEKQGMSRVVVNSEWIESVGKPFKLDISMHTDKNGKIHLEGEEQGSSVPSSFFIR